MAKSPQKRLRQAHNSRGEKNAPHPHTVRRGRRGRQGADGRESGANQATSPVGASSRLGVVSIWLYALAPLVFLPGIYDRWGWPVLFLHIFAAVLVVLAHPQRCLPTWLMPSVIGLAGLWSALALMGPTPLVHLFGRAPRYEGVLTWIALAATLWAAAHLFTPTHYKQAITTYATPASWGMIVFAGICILESMGYTPIPTDVARPGSLAGNATDQGLLALLYLAALTSAIAVNWQAHHARQPLFIAGAIGALTGLLTSASRGAYLASIPLIVVLVVVATAKSSHPRRTTASAAGILALIVGLTLILPDTRARFFSGDLLASRTFTERFTMLNISADLLATSPWHGIGPNTYPDAITAYLPREWYVHTESTAALDSPHNIAMHILLDAGIIGALAVLVFIGLITAHILRCYHAADPNARTLIILLSAGTTSATIGLLTTVNSPKVLLCAAFLLGAAIGTGYTHQPPISTTPASTNKIDTEKPATICPSGTPTTLLTRTMKLAGLLTLATTSLLLLAAIAGDALILRALTHAHHGHIHAANTAFTHAWTLRPWDADMPLRAAETIGGALETTRTKPTQPMNEPPSSQPESDPSNGQPKNAPAEHDIALQWATTATHTLPTSYRTHQALGMIHLNTGNVASAAESLKHALTLNPVNPQLHHSLGLALAFSERYKEAREHLEFALSIVPDSQPTQELLKLVNDETARH